MTRRDIDFSFKKHPLTGDIAIKTDAEAIKQSVRNIVLTNYYERGFNVEVAGNLNASMFEDIGFLTLTQIRSDITNALNNFEKQIDLLDVTVVDNDDNTIDVTIYFTIYNSTVQQSVSIELRRLR